jgi:hypothetical protein
LSRARPAFLKSKTYLPKPKNCRGTGLDFAIHNALKHSRPLKTNSRRHANPPAIPNLFPLVPFLHDSYTPQGRQKNFTEQTMA